MYLANLAPFPHNFPKELFVIDILVKIDPKNKIRNLK